MTPQQRTSARRLMAATMVVLATLIAGLAGAFISIARHMRGERLAKENTLQVIYLDNCGVNKSGTIVSPSGDTETVWTILDCDQARVHMKGRPSVVMGR